MTPLAHKYFKQLTMPVADRADDPYGILIPHVEMHCFEVSAIRQPISDSLDNHTYNETLFALPGPHLLPAPATWLEFSGPDGERVGYFILEMDDGWMMSIVNKSLTAHPIIAAVPPLEDGDRWSFLGKDNPPLDNDTALSLFTEALFLIDVIVTPSLVLKVPRDPHAGFARAFRNLPGGYPLHAWHEVLINPEAMKVVSDGKGKFSAKKCLHYCHGHRRNLSEGRVVAVKPHFRGDPALGMMRTKYRAAPIRRAAKALADTAQGRE